MNAPLNRPLSRFEAATIGVDTKMAKATGLKGRSVGGEIEAPAFESSRLFNYQSYFDDALLQNALQPQPSNEPIVPSTLSDSTQVAGYALGLHPSSECPIAVSFQTGAQQGASPTYRLKPGDVIRPHGSVRGKPGSFSGFQWGLPFGWLGGGMAKVVVMRTPDAGVFWTGNPEIIFHRQRMQVNGSGSGPALGSVALNWPKRFPWPNASYGALNIVQAGQPALAISPTRTALRLRLTALAAPADMRISFSASNDFAQDVNGAVSQSDVAFLDMTWGTFNQNGVIAPGAYYPTQMLTGQLERFACDNGGVFFTSLGSAELDLAYVDVVRYGLL